MTIKKKIHPVKFVFLVLSVISMVTGFLVLGFAPEPKTDEEGKKNNPTVQVNLGFGCIILSFFFLLFAFLSMV